MSSCKGLKTRSEHKTSKADINGDRISNLPESLIHHILSFLDMEFIVQTCVLSTRWRFLWMFFPFLSFHLNTGDEKKDLAFVNFVDKVLSLRDCSDIKSFRLRCFGYSKLLHEHLDTWIVHVTRHNVEEFDLTLRSTEEFKVPNCLFSCKPLITLKLSSTWGSQINQFVIQTHSISLPSLKTLFLGTISFDDEVIMNKLFSSFPLLESLTIYQCSFSSLTFSFPKLKYLRIDDCCYEEEEVPTDYNCKVEINAPNLTSLQFTDINNTRYQFNSCFSLNDADIQIFSKLEVYDHEITIERSANEKKEIAEMEVRLLMAICNVKELSISAAFVEFLSESQSVLQSFSTNFVNLSHLKLETSHSRESIYTVFHMLEISPNIEILNLEFSEKRGSTYVMCPFWDEFTGENVEECSEAGFPRQYMSHHLKFFEVHGILGCASELKFLELLLKAAAVLEEMVIFTSKSDSLETDRQCQKRLIKFSKKLLKLPRASSNIAILFHHPTLDPDDS